MSNFFDIDLTIQPRLTFFQIAQDTKDYGICGHLLHQAQHMSSGLAVHTGRRDDFNIHHNSRVICGVGRRHGAP